MEVNIIVLNLKIHIGFHTPGRYMSRENKIPTHGPSLNSSRLAIKTRHSFPFCLLNIDLLVPVLLTIIGFFIITCVGLLNE